MLHISPQEILKLKRQLIIERPQLFIPGLTHMPVRFVAQPPPPPPISPGNQTWASPGTYSFTVPNFNSLTAQVWGPGGGGSGAGYLTAYLGTAGGTGGYSQFGGGLLAYGGVGGPGGSTMYTSVPMTPGQNGTGYGGDSNITGGGRSPGGYGITYSVGGYKGGLYTSYGGNGGYGGYTTKTYTPSTLAPGTVVTIVVGGGGGAGSNGGCTYGYTPTYPTAGQAGQVAVSWS